MGEDVVRCLNNESSQPLVEIYENTLNEVPFNDVWYEVSGLVAGPLMTVPLVAKLDPWLGQKK